jgi:glycerophosphoryl diester phosphodiesterase
MVAVPTRFPFLDAGGPIAFAHRGADPGGRENTLAAVERVLGLGFGYLETDVRVTRDGVAVLLHDATLDRVSDRAGAVAGLTWAEVSRARVAGEPVARLDELLGTFRELRVNIDVKTPAAVGPLVAAVERAAAVDRVCVGSFSDRSVAAVRARLGRRLCTSLGPRGVLALRLGSLRGSPAGCAQVPPSYGPVRVLDRRFVAGAHRRGLAVHAWTVNDPAQMHRLLDLGVDGIMTDDAVALRDVLRQRRVWSR